MEPRTKFLYCLFLFMVDRPDYGWPDEKNPWRRAAQSVFTLMMVGIPIGTIIVVEIMLSVLQPSVGYDGMVLNYWIVPFTLAVAYFAYKTAIPVCAYIEGVSSEEYGNKMLEQDKRLGRSQD